MKKNKTTSFMPRFMTIYQDKGGGEVKKIIDMEFGEFHKKKGFIKVLSTDTGLKLEFKDGKKIEIT